MTEEPDVAERTAAARALSAQRRALAESTEPCDRPAAERAVHALYRAAGLAEPAVLWSDSPLGAALTVLVLRHHTDLLAAGGSGAAARLADDLADRLRSRGVDPERIPEGFVEPVVAEVWEQALEVGYDQVHRQLGRQVRTGRRVLERLDAPITAVTIAATTWEVFAATVRRLADDLVEEVLDALDPAGLISTLRSDRPDERTRAEAYLGSAAGYLTCGIDEVFQGDLVPLQDDRLEYLELLLRIADQPAPERVAAAVAVAREVGWWWPLRGVAVLTERPVDWHQDEDGFPHRADGPAISYADGLAVSVWHGQMVAPDLVLGDGWDAARILAEPNAELRRCAIERMGWERFLATADLTPAGDPVPDPGNPGRTLRLYDLPEHDEFGDPTRLLVVTNASVDRDRRRRVFGLLVPAALDDPVAAAAATFGLDAEEYAALERAT